MTAGWVEGAAMAVVRVEEVIAAIGLVRLLYCYANSYS